MRRAVGLALVLAVAACAPVGDRNETRDAHDADLLTKMLAGRTAGEAKRCLTSAQLEPATIVGRNLVYRDGRTTWVSAVPDCPNLAGDPILVLDIFGSQLCENDQFRTIARGGVAIPGPSCRFGKFIPYRVPR